MIKGKMTFKPLKSGGISILIDGHEKDIEELSRRYGKEVAIVDIQEEMPLPPDIQVVIDDLEKLKQGTVTLLTNVQKILAPEHGGGKEEPPIESE